MCDPHRADIEIGGGDDRKAVRSDGDRSVPARPRWSGVIHIVAENRGFSRSQITLPSAVIPWRDCPAAQVAATRAWTWVVSIWPSPMAPFATFAAVIAPSATMPEVIPPFATEIVPVVVTGPPVSPAPWRRSSPCRRCSCRRPIRRSRRRRSTWGSGRRRMSARPRSWRPPTWRRRGRSASASTPDVSRLA